MDRTAEVLRQALAGAAVTRHATVGVGALPALADAVRRFAPAASCLLVGDDNTMTAAGRASAALLEQAGLAVEVLAFAGPVRLKPDVEVARSLAGRLDGRTVTPIAVGSGVINDLVKFAAGLAQRPYVAVPTAASMDGYAASGAALIDNGFKRTFDCPPPVAIVADLHVVAAAPPAMAGWGYGDLAGKVVAGADWLLADALGVEAINTAPYALVQHNIADWLGDPVGIGRAAPAALGHLLEGLLISGFAMQAHGNSRPASGSDHQFAHLWEMERLSLGGEPVSHGACVGIGCVAMLGLYHWLLQQDMARLDIEAALAQLPDEATQRREASTAFADAELARNALHEIQAKAQTPDGVRSRLQALRREWLWLAARLRGQLPPPTQMAQWLRQAGAAHSPTDIGITADRLARDYRRARLIRRRYTLLDLLFELGWLDRAIAAQFAPGGIFHAAPAARASA